MYRMPRRLEYEKAVIEKMMGLYCRGNKHSQPCAGCDGLFRYATNRLERCVYGREKPACKNCPIHCYHTHKRRQIREVMRYAGPRMMIKYPLKALRHKIEEVIYQLKLTKAIK